jgi:NAD+ synthase (glutamine-hydrolysing)
MSSIRIAVVQMNPVMGALETNAAKISRFIQTARGQAVDLIVFPELALCGYPPEDLLLTQHFLSDTQEQLEHIAAHTQGIDAIVGFAQKKNGAVFNAAAWLKNGEIQDVYQKIELPNYGVFDEKRYFVPGGQLVAITVKNIRLALSVCEDVWIEAGKYETQLQQCPVDLIVNISASPFHADKLILRKEILAGFACRNHAGMVYCNLVGGQDELVFDGGNMFFNSTGELLASSGRFQESVLMLDLEEHSGTWSCSSREWQDMAQTEWQPMDALPHELTRVEEVFTGLVVGTRDYVQKNGFSHVVIGLSGGIDSALTAAIAVEAMGKERVVGVTMPSEYTSGETLNDARELADNLKIRFLSVPIGKIFQMYRDELQPVLSEGTQGVEYENLQARIRGNIIMALSNRYGWLVLTTGNKSEIATGYCTLYGDMAGGFAVIKDVPKMLVYELSQWINERAGWKIIPESTLRRPPTAELRPGQKDEDSLPPYPVLDAVLQAYVEEDKSPDEIIQMGHDSKVVMEVIRLVDRSEYKRRQAPPGIKITPKAFGRDRRLPLTNQYRPQPKPTRG